MYVNDYRFLLELARKYEFYYIAEPLAKYRIHGKNALEGSGPEATKRRRRGYTEEVQIRREMLRLYAGEIPDTTKAEIYASLGLCYAELGEYRKVFSSYAQAFEHNPYGWSNLAYIALFFKKRLADLLNPRT
jgi:tetratricopeptide (TPR) repeat protein